MPCELIAPGRLSLLTFRFNRSTGRRWRAANVVFRHRCWPSCCARHRNSYAGAFQDHPGAGSSYFYAEQAFASTTKAYRFARIAQIHYGFGPATCTTGSTPDAWLDHGPCSAVPPLSVLPRKRLAAPTTVRCSCICSDRVRPGCRLHRPTRFDRHHCGQHGRSTSSQITALLVFSVIAIAYRSAAPAGSTGYHLSSGVAVKKCRRPGIVKDASGNPHPCSIPTARRRGFAGKRSIKMSDSVDKAGIRTRRQGRERRCRTRSLPARFTVSYAPRKRSPASLR